MEKAKITRVLDGDTIETNSGERIRFIGVNAPELSNPGGEEATNFVKTLTLNKEVWLESDGNNKDGRGRLRRYVWIKKPTDPNNKNEIQNHQLNALLLKNNLAKVLIIGKVRHEALFYKLAKIKFIGTKTTKTLHLNTCNHLPKEQNRIKFPTKKEAITAGFKKCKHCNP
ncbi:MAG: thermonuclease family protein [Oscillospiraceae bacterium]|nr:thermonuclease family protein [Oscillospiraceae bacterium]